MTNLKALTVTVIIVLFGDNLAQSSNVQEPSDAQSQPLETVKKPNIVFILADDHGWHDVGYHGSEIETPTLDSLAHGGVKLENYYVQPICTPTRSQLLSGRYQIHTGLQHGVLGHAEPNGLPLDTPTIANQLKSQDYSTHIVGKWHIGHHKREYTPLERGFDSFFGYLGGSGNYFDHERCVNIRRKKICGIDLRDNWDVVWNNTEYSAHLFTRRARQIISNHNQSKPLFLYLPYQSVHGPLDVPEKYTKKYPFIRNKKRRKMAGMVSALDEAVQNVTEALKAVGIWENTILVYSTDNGGRASLKQSNYPLRGEKRTLWEGGMRGIGFVHSPLLNRSGVISKDLIHVTDWFPTLLKLAGGSSTGLKLDGVDVWSTISQGTPSPRGEILHNIDPLTKPKGGIRQGSPFDVRIRSALRYGQWKIITGNPGPGKWYFQPTRKSLTRKHRANKNKHNGKNVWLFNIHEDPEERNDLSDDRPDIVQDLLVRLARYNATAVPVQFPKKDPRANPKWLGGAWGPWIQ